MTEITKTALLVFKLDNLQVFYYQTLEDWSNRVTPKEYYWSLVGDHEIRGPFLSIAKAVENYEFAKRNPPPPPPANVIKVDFRAKKRI